MSNLTQILQNSIHHTIDVIQYFQIPEPQCPITLACEELIAPKIVCVPHRLIVLAAVKFDDQPFMMLREIQNIGSERRLPPEVKSLFVQFAQLPP